jgi:hypothetical protein
MAKPHFHYPGKSPRIASRTTGDSNAIYPLKAADYWWFP